MKVTGPKAVQASTANILTEFMPATVSSIISNTFHFQLAAINAGVKQLFDNALSISSQCHMAHFQILTIQ